MTRSFFPRRVCTRRLHTNNIFPQTLALKSRFESETNLFMEKCAEVAAAAFGPLGINKQPVPSRSGANKRSRDAPMEPHIPEVQPDN